MGNTASQLDDSDARLFELPALPGAPIGKHLRLIDVGERRIVLCGTAAVHTFERADRAGESLCVAMLSVAGVASDVEIGAAFGMHRNTVARHARRLAEGGVAAADRLVRRHELEDPAFFVEWSRRRSAETTLRRADVADT